MATEVAVEAAVAGATEIVAAEVTAAVEAGVSAEVAAEAASDIALYSDIAASLDAAAANLEPILGSDITNVCTKLMGGMEFSDELAIQLGADSDEFISYLSNYSQTLPGASTVTGGTVTATTMFLAVRSLAVSAPQKDQPPLNDDDKKLVEGLIQYATNAATAKGRKNAAKDIIGPELQKALKDAGHDTKYTYLKDRKKKILTTALIPFYGWGKAVAMVASLKGDAKQYLNVKAQNLVLERMIHSKEFHGKVKEEYEMALKLVAHSNEWKAKMEAARKEYQANHSEK